MNLNHFKTHELKIEPLKMMSTLLFQQTDEAVMLLILTDLNAFFNSAYKEKQTIEDVC